MSFVLLVLEIELPITHQYQLIKKMFIVKQNTARKERKQRPVHKYRTMYIFFSRFNVRVIFSETVTCTSTLYSTIYTQSS